MNKSAFTRELKTPKIVVGVEYEWTSAAGKLRGTVKEFDMDYTADGKMKPWIWLEDIKYVTDAGTLKDYKKVDYQLCSHEHMIMMKVKINGIPVRTIKSEK